ncbi:MAG: GNAT family N-acetyltransferase [Planctomycetota bacterium]|jgi:ribosomal protein S18 acetylase RimI-like enzyme|nr:GNAT family N-acetyltransferase [Planctomycetota bacterium]
MEEGGADGRLRIRPGEPGDYADILEIQRRAYAAKEVPLYGPDLPPLRETIEDLAKEAAAGVRILVGECRGRLVGSIRAERREGGEAHLYRLSVDPAWQGRGIGRRLALAAEEAWPDASALALDCGEKSLENLHIYRQLGYRETGQAIQVPDGPRCLVLRKPAMKGRRCAT